VHNPGVKLVERCCEDIQSRRLLVSVNSDDREAYEKGVEDSNKSDLDSFFDIGATFEDMNRSESERAAYEKGLKGKQLDEDKEE
jgi:hypothetical protein